MKLCFNKILHFLAGNASMYTHSKTAVVVVKLSQMQQITYCAEWSFNSTTLTNESVFSTPNSLTVFQQEQEAQLSQSNTEQHTVNITSK